MPKPAIKEQIPLTQHQVAVAYSVWLELKGGLLTPSRDVDWPAINAEIIERWGYSGLKRVKKAAWKIAAERERVLA